MEKKWACNKFLRQHISHNAQQMPQLWSVAQFAQCAYMGHCVPCNVCRRPANRLRNVCILARAPCPRSLNILLHGYSSNSHPYQPVPSQGPPRPSILLGAHATSYRNPHPSTTSLTMRRNDQAPVQAVIVGVATLRPYHVSPPAMELLGRFIRSSPCACYVVFAFGNTETRNNCT